MGLYYNPNPPHIGAQQPLEPRKLVPPQSGPAPQNPPFPGSSVSQAVLLCWAVVAPTIILPNLLVPQPAVAGPAFTQVRYDIYRAWDPPPPMPQYGNRLTPPQSGPPPQNPPIVGTPIPQAVIAWWNIPPPAPIVAINLIPPSAPQNAPLIGTSIPPGRAWWDIPPPMPIVAVNLNPPIGASPPSNPPIIGTSIPLAVQAWWNIPPPMPITAPIRQTITGPAVIIPAQYRLLNDHYLASGYAVATTVVTEGKEIPFDWIPTTTTEPLNTQAIQKFWNAGPAATAAEVFNQQAFFVLPSPVLVYWQPVPGTHGYYQLTGAGASLGVKQSG